MGLPDGLSSPKLEKQKKIYRENISYIIQKFFFSYFEDETF